MWKKSLFKFIKDTQNYTYTLYGCVQCLCNTNQHIHFFFQHKLSTLTASSIFAQSCLELLVKIFSIIIFFFLFFNIYANAILEPKNWTQQWICCDIIVRFLLIFTKWMMYTQNCQIFYSKSQCCTLRFINKGGKVQHYFQEINLKTVFWLLNFKIGNNYLNLPGFFQIEGKYLNLLVFFSSCWGPMFSPQIYFD